MIEIIVSGLSIVIAIAVGLVLYFNNVDIDKNLKSITNQINDVNTSSASIEETQNKVLKTIGVDLSQIKNMQDKYATKTMLNDYAKNDKLSAYAKNDTLKEYAKTIDLNPYAKIADLNSNITSDLGTFKKLNVGSTISNTSASDPGPMIEKNYGVGNSFGLGQYVNGTLRVYGGNKNQKSTVNLSIMKNDGTFNDAVTVDSTGNIALNGDTLAKKKLSASAYSYSNNVQGKNWASYINPNNGFMVFDPNFNGTMTNMGVMSLGGDGTLNSAGMANFKGDVKTGGNLSGSNLCLNNSVPSQCMTQDDVSYLKTKKASQMGEYSQVYIKNKDGRSSHLAYSDSVNYLRGNVAIDQDSLTIGATPVAGTKGLNIRNPDGRFTHFPYSDGRNYIRGDTQIDGNVNTGHLQAANINLTRNWRATPDRVTDVAEISNDTNAYKTLMIVGNKSAGGVRKVGIWDELNVNGTLNATGNITTIGRHIDASTDWVGKGKTLFTGWHGQKVVVGNNATGSMDWAANQPAQTVAVTNDLAVRGNTRIENGDNSFTTYGPNTSWNSTLAVGAGPNRGGPAQVLSTNGNVHIDSSSQGPRNIYLNYYNPGNVMIGNPAGTANQLCLGSVCLNEAQMKKLKTLAV